MRNRVASRLVVGYDVCLFCTLRPLLGQSTHVAKRHDARRKYGSSAVLRLPANATAARQYEDDADESPMLKQNLKLADDFPSLRPSAPPPSVPQSRARRPPEAEPTDTKHYDRRDRRSSGTGTFRNNFGSFARRDNDGRSGQAGQDHLNMNKGREKYADTRSSLKHGISMQRAADRDQFQQRPSPANQELSSEPAKPKTFRTVRFRIDQDTNPSDVSRGGPSRQEPDRDDRSLDRLLEASDQERRRASRSRSHVGPTSPLNDPPEREQIKPARDVLSRIAGTRELGTEARRSQGPDTAWRPFMPPASVQNITGNIDKQTVVESPERVEVPIGMSLESSHDEYESGFRRGHREDRSRPKPSRFEEADATDSAQTTSTPTRRVQSSMRANHFDYEMAEAEEALYGERKRKKKKGKQKKDPEAIVSRPRVNIPEFLSVGQLANALNTPLERFKLRLEEEGYEGARHDHILDAQTASMFADLYGYEPILASEDQGMDLFARPPPEDVSSLPARPPIVTIMGHVDHGKTTILDYLRKSSVVASEHGGITQHIGAFSVTMPGTNRQITFLDTPGHAAFLEMRRRGANVTDIVVLVVAADDSVKPQTIEAIKHAIDARVQIIVAINKVDKEDANVERVKQDLSRHEIVVEDYGGDYQAIPVSGKTGQGMEDLEEAIITLADVNDFRAERDGLAEGTIIESKVTTAGRVATVLVRRGTIRVGDCIVAGTTWARVRTLRDDTGQLVSEAPPGTPVQVDGWRGEDPSAGLEVLQAEDEQQAKDAVDFRIEKRDIMRTTTELGTINEARSEEAEARAKVLAWEAKQAWSKLSHGRRPKDNAGWVEPGASDGPERVHFVVKADVAGSVEAVAAAVTAVGNNEIVANVIHTGTGQVTESDITMLGATGETGFVISFNQPIDGTMYRLAEAAGLRILDHNIIYKVTDAVKSVLAEQLSPIVTQRVVGEAEIGQIFEITVKKNKMKIAGCKVTNGTISRAQKVRVLRDGSEIYTGTLDSLKNVKKDVTEMRKGTECGMGFENWDDFREGDQVQCFEEHEEKRTLY